MKRRLHLILCMVALALVSGMSVRGEENGKATANASLTSRKR